jgi:dTDP-4-dehydrorhamnose 3,5-epimerase
MHFQIAPKEEPKLIRCTRGAIHDVLVDLRKDSPTYLQTFETELSERNHRLLYAPPGVAHGFQTLEDETEIFYEIGETYSPEHARGLRWNDPAYKIRFPLPITVIAPKDLSFADYRP